MFRALMRHKLLSILMLFRLVIFVMGGDVIPRFCFWERRRRCGGGLMYLYFGLRLLDYSDVNISLPLLSASAGRSLNLATCGFHSLNSLSLGFF